MLGFRHHSKRGFQTAHYIPTISVKVARMRKPTDGRLVIISDADFNLVRVRAVGPEMRAPVGHVEGADAFCVGSDGRGGRRRGCGAGVIVGDVD